MRLGIDSIKAIGAINELEEELDIMIDNAQFWHFTSLRAIVGYIEGLPQ